MADNVILNPGVGGDSIALEEIGGVKYEKVKLIDSTAGSTAPIGVAANPLKVDGSGATQPVSAVALPLPAGAATDANQATIIGHVDGIETLVTATNAALAAVTKAEDAAHSSGDSGIMALAVRRDADTAFGADNDYGPLATDANGYLKVNIKAGAGSGGTALADDAAFTPAVTSFTPVGGIVTSDSVDSGDGGAFAMLANRQQKVTLYDSAGGEVSVGGGTQYATNVAYADGNIGTLAITIRDDVLTTLTEADGDYSGLRVDSTGRLWTNVANTVTVSGTVTANAGTNLNTSALALESGGNLAGAATSLAVMDDWDESDRAKVNLIVGQAGIAGGTGVDGATVPRVTLATNVGLPAGSNSIGAVTYATTGSGNATGALRVELANNGTGVLATVGAVTAITNSLPAGTNAIGKLAANSGVDIGDVDVTSLVPGTAATSLGKAVDGVGGATDTGVMALAIRDDSLSTLTPVDGDYTQLRTDSTGALWCHLTSSAVTLNATQTDDAAFTPGSGVVLPIAFLADESSTDSVDEGDAGIARMTLDRKQIATIYPHAAAGGSLPFKNLDVDESEDDVKTSPGKLFWLHVMNLASAKRYLKIYNATAANVTVGTTTPVHTFPLPTQGDTNGAGFTIHFGDMGQFFDTAICIAATTGLADNDTGAPGANEIVVNGGYI